MNAGTPTSIAAAITGSGPLEIARDRRVAVSGSFIVVVEALAGYAAVST